MTTTKNKWYMVTLIGKDRAGIVAHVSRVATILIYCPDVKVGARFRVVEGLDVPAVGRNLRDRVHAVAQELPELLFGLRHK